MWYWMLPPAVLTAACLAIPQYLYGVANYIDVGQLNRRNMEVDYRDFYLYMRDRRISGSEYSQRGLEYLNKPLVLTKTKYEIPWTK